MKRIALILISLAIAVAGCGSGGGGPSTAPVVTSSNASSLAVDCQRQRAYIAVPAEHITLDASVAVLDLSVNPNTTDPRLSNVDLGHAGVAQSAAVDPAQGIVMVTSGLAANNGFLDLINESNNTLVQGSPFSFPNGSRPAPNDGIVFDQADNMALVSMTGDSFLCSGATSTCTGMAEFDLGSKSFGPLIQFNDSVDNFAFDPTTQISLAPSDPIDPTIWAVDAKNHAGCQLTDGSLTTLDDDPDGAGVDPSTNIWVIGNYDSPMATAINLAGATFSGSTPPCNLDEAGTLPNSVNIDTGTGSGMPGVAVNPLTHQAVLTGVQSGAIALLSLPTASVTQLAASSITAVNSMIPTEPDGLPFESADFPYGDTIDACHNRVYILNDTETWLAEIDLSKFQSNPSGIATPLPAGSCAGTTSTIYGCNNNNGVRFFPLPAVL